MAKVGGDCGLDAEPFNCKVIASLLPKNPTVWDDDAGNVVEFHPFLIITEALDREDRAVWLPYWHTVRLPEGEIKTKYGQWAPHMNVYTFSELIQQAQSARLL